MAGWWPLTWAPNSQPGDYIRHPSLLCQNTPSVTETTSRAHSTSALPFLLSSFRRSECTGSRKSRPPKLRPSPETLHPRSRRAIKFLGSASLRDCSLLPNDYFLVAQLHCEHLHCID